MSEENINILSKESKFTQRESGKINGFEMLELLISTNFRSDKLSLNNQCEQFEDQTGKSIAKQSLNERFNKRLILLITCEKEFKGFGGIASKSTIKIQFEYDFLNGEVHDLSLHTGTYNDTRDAKATINKLEKGDCILRDLGYFVCNLLVKIINIGAFYFSKLNNNINIYTKQKNKKFNKINFSTEADK